LKQLIIRFYERHEGAVTEMDSLYALHGVKNILEASILYIILNLVRNEIDSFQFVKSSYYSKAQEYIKAHKLKVDLSKVKDILQMELFSSFFHLFFLTMFKFSSLGIETLCDVNQGNSPRFHHPHW
jgi:hypothetical protein